MRWFDNSGVPFYLHIPALITVTSEGVLSMRLDLATPACLFAFQVNHTALLPNSPLSA